LQKIELHARAVRNCTGLMTGFENLSEVVNLEIRLCTPALRML
jgi:hypothetical protein